MYGNQEDGQDVIVPTWDTHYLLPVAQNITGGGAVAGLIYLGVIAYTGAAGHDVDFYNAGVWCALAGGAVACVLTIVRFFGDELGLLVLAYREGQRSRDAQIAALEMRALEREDVAEYATESSSVATVINKQTEAAQRVRRGALLMLKVAFDGDTISRKAMADRGLGQRDFERARLLLKAAGVMDGLGNILATEISQAVLAVDQQVEKDLGKGDKYLPSW